MHQGKRVAQAVVEKSGAGVERGFFRLHKLVGVGDKHDIILIPVRFARLVRRGFGKADLALDGIQLPLA